MNTKKLIILGNGFDLASTLKSTYKDFFSERIDTKNSDSKGDKRKYLCTRWWLIWKRIYTNDDRLSESCIEVSKRNKAYVPPHAKTCRFTGIFGENLYEARRNSSR